MSEDFSFARAARRPSKTSKNKRKSEVVTVRLDPKLKYLAELAARRFRRTLSSYIEWAIEDSLSRVHLKFNPSDSSSTVADEASSLWDVDEPDRFAKLALHYPDLLDHEEQRIWKLIRENGVVWFGSDIGRWDVTEENLNWDRLREHWETFRAVARGNKPPSALPDDIPF
jgi:hypothetical protein